MPKAENGWKVCAKCRKNFPVSEYSSNRLRSDGLSHNCKQCASENDGKPPLWLNIEEFIALYPKTPIRELCARYCRTEGTITRWAYWLRKNDHNIPFHSNRHGARKPRKYDHKIYAEFANGKPLSAIADYFGIARQTVVCRNQVCRKEGYVINTPKGYYK